MAPKKLTWILIILSDWNKSDLRKCKLIVSIPNTKPRCGWGEISQHQWWWCIAGPLQLAPLQAPNLASIPTPGALVCVYVCIYICTHTCLPDEFVNDFLHYFWYTYISISCFRLYKHTDGNSNTSKKIPASNSEILLCILYQPSFLSFLLKQLANSCFISWQGRNSSETLLNLELSFKHLMEFKGIADSVHSRKQDAGLEEHNSSLITTILLMCIFPLNDYRGTLWSHSSSSGNCG